MLDGKFLASIANKRWRDALLAPEDLTGALRI